MFRSNLVKRTTQNINTPYALRFTIFFFFFPSPVKEKRPGGRKKFITTEVDSVADRRIHVPKASRSILSGKTF